MNKPVGVSSFELSEIVPEELKTQLPTVEEMERGCSIIRRSIKFYKRPILVLSRSIKSL
jgi:hypothetical protein